MAGIKLCFIAFSLASQTFLLPVKPIPAEKLQQFLQSRGQVSVVIRVTGPASSRIEGVKGKCAAVVLGREKVLSPPLALSNGMWLSVGKGDFLLVFSRDSNIWKVKSGTQYRLFCEERQ